MNKVRFRQHGGMVIAGLIMLVSALPAVLNAWYLVPILLLPVAVALWGWRAGTDADADGVTVRAAFGSRHYPWPAIAAIVPQKDRVEAILRNGRTVQLTGVRGADLGRLLAASGEEPNSGEEPTPGEERAPGQERAPATAETPAEGQ